MIQKKKSDETKITHPQDPDDGQNQVMELCVQKLKTYLTLTSFYKDQRNSLLHLR